jgi:hypothetical protein
MNSEESEFVFTPGARWIWVDAASDTDAWWMFRKALALPSDCREARIRITAGFHYLLYVNGKLVTRGPARSYNFRKAYDTIDLNSYLRPGAENVLAMLAPAQANLGTGPHGYDPRGILAELTWRNARGEQSGLATNRDWKVRRHAAFPAGSAGRAMGFERLIGREELFDARREPQGWNAPGFDDSTWDEARELGHVGMAPWTKLVPSGIGLLSDDPIFPQSFTAIELARLRPGYRLRLEVPARFGDSIKVYASEVTCAASAAVQFHVEASVHLNGQQVDSHVPVILPQGTSLLCFCQRGYGSGELDVLFETEAGLSFSARNLLARQDGLWAVYPLPAGAVNFPWHETPSTIPDPPELPRLLAVPTAAALPVDLRAGFLPVSPESGSVALDVMTQRVYRVQGGHTHPAIDKGQPRLPAIPGLASPVRNPQNLLHDHADATTILPTPGYDAHLIVDFGRECIGYLEFTLDAPAGTVVDAQGFEVISPRGIDWMRLHNGFRYTCREGWQTFTSHFRRGFRYVSVTVRGFDRPVEFQSIRCRRAAYPVQATGSFECGDWQLNQAYRICADTSALCMLDTYVDCPGHEQSFWVGDAVITAQSNLLNFGAYDLDQRSIRLVGQSLSSEWVQEYWPHDERFASGRYLPIAAFPNYPAEGGLPMWPMLWVIQCWHHYLYGGSLDDLRENYGYVAEMLRRCRLLTNERGLLDIPGAWNLLEWGTNDLSPYGEVTANNTHLVLSLRLAARMAQALGLPDEANAHEAEAGDRQAAINRLCWDGERQAYVDTVRDEWAYQRYLELCAVKGWASLPWETYHSCLRVSEQTNTAALFCDCVPADRQDAVKCIVRRVERGRFVSGSPAGRSLGAPSEQEAPDGIVAIGSPYFLYFSLGTLFKIGESRHAIEVIRREWGKMIALGFRTCPETFGWTRSLAHAWSASPAVYLLSQVLGVRPLEPGYRVFAVEPCAADLQWARGEVATPYGPIHVDWRRNDGNELVIAVSAPPECRRQE